MRDVVVSKYQNAVAIHFKSSFSGENVFFSNYTCIMKRRKGV